MAQQQRVSSFIGGKYHAQSQRVLRDSSLDQVVNTNRAYDPKMLEFKQFCSSLYGDDPSAQIVDEEKAFVFLFYQAYREKKSTGKRLSCSDRNTMRFDRKDYDQVMRSVADNGAEEDCRIGNVLGFDMVNQYRCAIKKVLRHQRDQGLNKLKKDDIDSERIDRLMENVLKRKDRVSKANFKERVDGEFTPYKMIDEVHAIEDYMWHYGCTTLPYCAASLRDRYQYLATLAGVLRSESLYRGDLSDLCDFKFNQRLEPSPYHIGIQRVSMGKANADKVLYGRAIRHREPQLCSIGALGFYLMARFHVTDEIDCIDFSDNATWFNRKILSRMVDKERNNSGS